MFIIAMSVIASHTHTTPDTVDAIVFWSPCVLPPAAKKQAHATMPAGTARLAIAPTFTHRAISTPILTASAISMSIRCGLLLLWTTAKTAPAPAVMGGVRAVPAHCADQRMWHPASSRRLHGSSEKIPVRLRSRPTVGTASRTVKNDAYVNCFTSAVRALSAVRVLERGLGPVLHAQLREQMLYVEFHGVVGQAESLGDLR